MNIGIWKLFVIWNLRFGISYFMLIFLYGQDTYRLHQKLGEIEREYKKFHKAGLNFEKIEVDRVEFQEFLDKLFQNSMFIKKKLFFLEDVFSNPKFKEGFLKNIKKIAKSEDIVVIYEKKDIKKEDKFFLLLKKYGKSQEFKLLKGNPLRNWIKKEFENYKIEINSITLEKLISFVGSDPWRLPNEIQKLATFKKILSSPGLKREIRNEDIDFLVRPKIELSIFKTIDALGVRDKKKALRLVHQHLEKGESPLYVLKMINFQFRNLFIARDLKESGKTFDDLLRLKIFHPYVARKSWQASDNFSLGELKKIYKKIFEIDLGIKTGKITPEAGLEILITEI